jgi:hypothetical protein
MTSKTGVPSGISSRAASGLADDHEWNHVYDHFASCDYTGAMGVRMLPRGPYDKPPTPRVETIKHIDPGRFTLIRDNINTVRATAGCPIKIRAAR